MKLKDYLLNIQEFVFSLTRAHFMIIKYRPHLHISRFVTCFLNVTKGNQITYHLDGQK